MPQGRRIVLLCAVAVCWVVAAAIPSFAKDNQTKTYPENGIVVDIRLAEHDVGFRARNAQEAVDTSRQFWVYRVETRTATYELQSQSVRARSDFAVGDRLFFRVKRETAYVQHGAKERTYDIVKVRKRASGSLAQGTNSPPPPAKINIPREATEEYCRNLAVANAAAESLVEVCRFALSSEQRMPNFICAQTTERYEPRLVDNTHSTKAMRLASVIKSTVTYLDGVESYSGESIDGKFTDRGMLDFLGMTSIGEFATQLRNVFAPESNAAFRFVRETTVDSQRALVYSFEIAAENSRWVILAGAMTRRPAYRGQISFANSPFRVVHLEQDAKLADFPYTSVSKSIDYGEVKLGERGVFNLPKHVRSYACRDAQNEDCLRNEIKFDNCRKFTVETKIITTQP